MRPGRDSRGGLLAEANGTPETYQDTLCGMKLKLVAIVTAIYTAN